MMDDDDVGDDGTTWVKGGQSLSADPSLNIILIPPPLSQYLTGHSLFGPSVPSLHPWTADWTLQLLLLRT